MKAFADNFNSAILKHDGAICYNKSVVCLKRNDDGAAINTQTKMSATTKNGIHAMKSIMIDDDAGKTSEDVIAHYDITKPYHFKACNLTGYRCSEMTVLAISMLYGSPEKVGFIGTGKTNLLNAIAIEKNFFIDEAVIRGSKRNYAKNAGEFMTVFDNVSIDTSDDMRLLNECDVVIECCNNCNKDELISTQILNKPKLIVALDCGFLLDESFREERVSFSDWPEQLERHYDEEFVFDKNIHKFKQMKQDHEPYDKAVVYLYGVAIADAVAAERMIWMVEKNGMEKTFLVK